MLWTDAGCISRHASFFFSPNSFFCFGSLAVAPNPPRRKPRWRNPRKKIQTGKSKRQNPKSYGPGSRLGTVDASACCATSSPGAGTVSSPVMAPSHGILQHDSKVVLYTLLFRLACAWLSDGNILPRLDHVAPSPARRFTANHIMHHATSVIALFHSFRYFNFIFHRSCAEVTGAPKKKTRQRLDHNIVKGGPALRMATVGARVSIIFTVAKSTA